MDDGAVSDVRTGTEGHGLAREHVQDTVFLNVAAVFNDDLSPIASDGGAGSDVHISADDHISRDVGLRVHIGRFVNDRLETVEFVDHTRSMMVAYP